MFPLLVSASTFSVDTVSAFLSALWIITGAVAIQLRASSKAQRKALRRLRDKDVEWALYCHQLRVDLANLGVTPREMPTDLVVDPDVEPL